MFSNWNDQKSTTVSDHSTPPFLLRRYVYVMFTLYLQTETIGASNQPDSTTNGDVTIGNPMYDESFDGFEDNFM